MVQSPAGKENSPPVTQPNGSETGWKAEQHDASLAAAIVQKQDHIQSFQKWWSKGHGDEAAASHALLHVVDGAVLADVISAGAAYHNCLGIEKLDALLNKLDQAAGDTSLDPLRKAMQTKGGARNQARAVGTLLFSTARAVYDQLGPSEVSHVRLNSGKECRDRQQPGNGLGRPNSKTSEDSESMDGLDCLHSKRIVPEPDFISSQKCANTGERAATEQEGGLTETIIDSKQKLDPVKADKEAEAVPAGASTEEAILEQQDQVQRFQSWWAEGKGKETAKVHPMLSILDAAVLADIVAAGANYHNCLSADRLDALQRQVGNSNAPGLETLQRALQAKGGAKSQARAVGSVIFKEAMDIFKNPPDMSKSSASSEGSQLAQAGRAEAVKPGVIADEIFETPKRFVCSESFPPEATVAVRLEPNKASSLVTSLPYGSEVLATAVRGTYLQFKLDNGQDNNAQYVWVPRVFDGLVLFVEKLDPVKADKEAEAVPAGASTEEAILEQQDQVQRFQSWWAEGKGKETAKVHPMLSILDAAVLADIVAAGANYHNCLSADRLDALQRQVGNSNAPGLETLQRALQAKGGAKSQARAVGSVIFKEAMDIFKNPPDMSKSSASSEGSQLAQAGRAEAVKPGVIADEIFETPKRFVCSESFPPEATVAVRAAPSHESEYLMCLPHGTEILCTGRFGDFLRFQPTKEGAEAYVPWMFRGLTLFVPGAAPRSPSTWISGSEERFAQLEERVLQQETIIKALQAELFAMRAHMSAVATAFGTLASRPPSP